jgi:hypothetical protein
VPLLSASTSLIMSCNSDSEGFWPSDRITVPSSLVVICPTTCYQHSDMNWSHNAMCHNPTLLGGHDLNITRSSTMVRLPRRYIVIWHRGDYSRRGGSTNRRHLCPVSQYYQQSIFHAGAAPRSLMSLTRRSVDLQRGRRPP